MTRFLLLFAIGSCLSLRALFACDFCNCLSGINPYYNGKNRFVLNFLSQRSFRPPVLSPASTSSFSTTKHTSLPTLMHGGHTPSAFPTTETRRSIEMMLQHHFSERFLLTVLVPFSTLTIEQGTSLSVSGIGDVSLLVHDVFEFDFLDRTILLLGAGIKTPTGLSNLTDAKGTRLDTRFQSGTGSWDFILNPTFFASHRGFIYALDLFAKFNTSSTVGDRIGHSLSATTTLSHDIFRNNASQMALVGIIGARLETKSKDWISGRFDADSDFTSLYGQVGGQVIFHFVKLDFLVLAPLHQSRSALAMNEQTRFLTGARIEF
ncbi:MAG: hypothetical protein ACK412_03735 [Chloroherpetonaceae bacterium]